MCVCVSLSRTPVTWQLNNSSALPWHRVTSDGGLVLIKVGLSAQGDYSCWDGQGLLLHAIRLRLGRESPPLLSAVALLSLKHLRSTEEVLLISHYAHKGLHFLQMSPTGSCCFGGLPFGARGCFQTSNVSLRILSLQRDSRALLHHLFSSKLLDVM